MSPDIARRVVAAFQRGGAAERPDHALTPHEVRIVRMLANGDSYREVADQLGITVNRPQ
jgi:DNA-binding CsgD family transcriptional regulator